MSLNVLIFKKTKTRYMKTVILKLEVNYDSIVKPTGFHPNPIQKSKRESAKANYKLSNYLTDYLNEFLRKPV